MCNCSPGFGGDNCSVNIFDDCNPDLCQNRATCTDIGADFMCLCPPGFTGRVCELPIDYCAMETEPCQNGGQCENNLLNYTCNCVGRFIGSLCETNLDPCSSTGMHTENFSRGGRNWVHISE